MPVVLALWIAVAFWITASLEEPQYNGHVGKGSCLVSGRLNP